MALSATQARRIGREWGAASATMVERMVSAAMELGFRKLLRYSDFCLVHTAYIYWMGAKGFAYALVHRKNDQRYIGKWQTVADIGPGCFARRFRQFIRDQNPGIRVPGLKDPWGFASGPGADSFVFRRFGAPRGAPKKWSRRRFQTSILDGGQDPVTLDDSDKFYKRYKTAMQQALVSCCGLSRTAAKIYGTQSLRRGGNTALWIAGATKVQRLQAGSWASPEMDDEYLQQSVELDVGFAREIELRQA